MSPPVVYPADTESRAQAAFEVGWYRQTAKTLTCEIEFARAEIARLRESALEAITQLEGGVEAERVVDVLAEGLWPENAS